MTKLAIDTVLYAVQCVRSNERELALNAIRDTNSLPEEQQLALIKIIQDLGTAKLAPKDLDLAEVHMIYVLNPSEKDPLYTHMVRLYTKVSYATQKTLRLKDIRLRPLIFMDLDARGFLENFPELETFELNENSNDIPEIAKGIQEFCPHFKCLNFTARNELVSLVNHFSNSIKTFIWDAQGFEWQDRRCGLVHLNFLAGLPHLTEITFKTSVNFEGFSHPEVFDRFTHLEKLTIPIPIEGVFDTLQPDAKLAMLKRIPHLQALDVRNSDLSFDAVRKFASAKRATLKQMTLSASSGLDLSEIARLRTLFPTIEFIHVEKEKENVFN